MIKLITCENNQQMTVAALYVVLNTLQLQRFLHWFSLELQQFVDCRQLF